MGAATQLSGGCCSRWPAGARLGLVVLLLVALLLPPLATAEFTDVAWFCCCYRCYCDWQGGGHSGEWERDSPSAAAAAAEGAQVEQWIYL